MISRGSVLLAAALMLTSSCGNAAREGEIACQRRLVALTDAPIASPQRAGMGALVEQIRQNKDQIRAERQANGLPNRG